MRLLVTGASGLLGLNLAIEASHEHEVIGSVNRNLLNNAPSINAFTTPSKIADRVPDPFPSKIVSPRIS